MNTKEKILYIDAKDSHLDDENAFAIHPKKISWLTIIQKESFDKVIIQNVSTSSLKSLTFFNISQVLKQSGIVDVLVDQSISVMQSLEASEIEANAKLAGFVDIQQSDFEKWYKDGEKDMRISTVKVSMIRPEKIGILNPENNSPSKTSITGVKKLKK